MKKLLSLLLCAALILAGCAASGNGSLDGDYIDAPDLPDNATAVPVTTPSATDDPLEGVAAPDGIPDVDDKGQTEKLDYERDYESYAKNNKDVIGWISVPNTLIEYPVVVTSDNEYYLHYNYKKEKSKSGAVFMDYRNADFENARHVIIYGHNMRNGTMFHDLNSYKYKDFFNQNPVITFYYKGEKYEYEVFAADVVLADINFIRTRATRISSITSRNSSPTASSRTTLPSARRTRCSPFRPAPTSTTIPALSSRPGGSRTKPAGSAQESLKIRRNQAKLRPRQSSANKEPKAPPKRDGAFSFLGQFCLQALQRLVC